MRSWCSSRLSFRTVPGVGSRLRQNALMKPSRNSLLVRTKNASRSSGEMMYPTICSSHCWWGGGNSATTCGSSACCCEASASAVIDRQANSKNAATHATLRRPSSDFDNETILFITVRRTFSMALNNTGRAAGGKPRRAARYSTSAVAWISLGGHKRRNYWS